MSNQSNQLLFLLRNQNDAFDLADCVVVLVRNGRDSREHAVVFQQPAFQLSLRTVYWRPGQDYICVFGRILKPMM